MKKALFSSALFLFLIASCSKDGATGPVGPTGPTGATGGINLTVVNATYAPSDFTTYGTYGQAQYRSSVTTSIPQITQSVYDSGMVLVYYQGSGTNPLPWYPLPQTLYETNYSYSMTYAHYLGGVNIQL